MSVFIQLRIELAIELPIELPIAFEVAKDALATSSAAVPGRCDGCGSQIKEIVKTMTFKAGGIIATGLSFGKVPRQ